MPLRDHFHPPVSLRRGWDMLHGCWPAIIVQHLFPRLPAAFVARPSIHVGRDFKVDVGSMEEDTPSGPGVSGGGLALWAPARPTLTVEADLSAFDEYEVRVYNTERGERLVAAVEIVSPGNKDRPESRQAFVNKCGALLREDVALTIVDLVTEKHFNLYAELLDQLGHADPALGDEPAAIYAASLRPRRRRGGSFLDAWAQPLVLGEPLPTLPLWLDASLAVPLELEASYEETCRLLRIA